MTSSNGNIYRIAGSLCEIHRSPMNSPHKGQSHGAFIFPLICAWTNGWVNNRDTCDLRRHRAHHGVTLMNSSTLKHFQHSGKVFQLTLLMLVDILRRMICKTETVVTFFINKTRLRIFTQFHVICTCVHVCVACLPLHYSDVIMGAMASHITRIAIVYAAICSCADQRKHLSPTSLANFNHTFIYPYSSRIILQMQIPYLRRLIQENILPRDSLGHTSAKRSVGILRTKQTNMISALSKLLYWPKVMISLIVSDEILWTSAQHIEAEAKWPPFPDDISNAFSWMKIYDFQLRFHWLLFTSVQLTIF